MLNSKRRASLSGLHRKKPTRISRQNTMISIYLNLRRLRRILHSRKPKLVVLAQRNLPAARKPRKILVTT
nr:MAG TPA: hypothetical protein [Caudoviricetes sp.]